MKRLLTTTALVMLTTLPVQAEQNVTEATAGAEASATMDRHIPDPAMNRDGLEIHASNLLGNPVYVRSDAEADAVFETEIAEVPADWERTGEIGDVILDSNGEIKSVVMDVGGFLGIGEKQVSAGMDELKFLRDADDSEQYFVVYTGARANLETRETYDRQALDAEGDRPYSELSEMQDDAARATAELRRDASKAAGSIADTTGEAVDSLARNAGEAMTEAERATERAFSEVEHETGDALDTAERERQDSLNDIGATDAGATAEAAVAAEEIDGAPVLDATGAEIGEISEIVVADSGRIDKVVIDVGGFLGLGEKPVAISFQDVNVLEGEAGTDIQVQVSHTESELENMARWNG